MCCAAHGTASLLRARARAADGIGRPLLPLLGGFRRLAAGVRLLRAAAVLAARRYPAAGASPRLVDGIRHPPRRLRLGGVHAAGVRVPPASPRGPGLSPALRRPGAPLRRAFGGPGRGGPPLQLPAGGVAPDRALRGRVGLSAALPELQRRGAGAAL